jgi:hypothetical protein
MLAAFEQQCTVVVYKELKMAASRLANKKLSPPLKILFHPANNACIGLDALPHLTHPARYPETRNHTLSR